MIPNIKSKYNATEITSLRVEPKNKFFKKGCLRTSLNLNFKSKRHSFEIGFQYNSKFSNLEFSNKINKNAASFKQTTSRRLVLKPFEDFIEFKETSHISRRRSSCN